MRRDPNTSELVASSPGPYGEMRRATAAAGLALPTSLSLTSFVALPKWTQIIQLIARTFTTGVVAQILINPRLSVLKTVNDGVTFTDYSDAAQDGLASTDVVLSSLDTLANLNYVYIGAGLPFAGLHVDVDSANSNASVLTVKYRKIDDTWASVTPTDGTASGGATFAQDGAITWTVPTDWKKSEISGQKLYWLRLEVSAALDASTTLDGMWPINRSTANFEIVPNTQPIEMEINHGVGGDGCLQVMINAGTGTLIVNAAAGPGRSFAS